MERINNYNIQGRLAETRSSVVYRGTRKSDGLAVMVKALKAVYPSPSAIARFRQEYAFISGINCEGTVKAYDIAEYNGSYAIILEDFTGISLKEILRQKTIEIEGVLRIGIQLASALGHIHKENIIHRDLKPANIMINENTGQVKITDFGISKLLTNEDMELYNPLVIEGSLPYISPEQTGRMSRTVDYRTDLYSLGITLYEMLTGVPPFRSADPMEIIHAHIARRPIFPSDLDSRIPDAISDITIKLLSKTAEERYQNGFGLMADLQECLDQYRRSGAIRKFTIARKDVSIRFLIPLVVYGREKEIDSLMSAFRRISKGRSELLLISGDPGIGKSAAVHEIQKPIISTGGYFISGKYDQFRQEVPYSAIIQALQGLVDMIITESDDKIALLRKNLARALGPNGGFVTSAIPRLELIIGRQKDIPESDDVESRNLFNNVLLNFIAVFADQEHPLILFLDDAHWADAASLGFIRRIMTDPEIKHLLLILSYRDQEADGAHPFMTTLERIKKEKAAVSIIKLGPLDLESVNRLICNFLRTGVEETRPLAGLIHRKTNGNPFFVNQFLKTIYDGGMLLLEPGQGWTWDIQKIEVIKVTDNVVDLMVNVIKEMPSETQEMLKICACIGNRFDLETISNAFNKPIDETLAELTRAMDRGFISSSGDLYIFQHDRIHETAYSMLSDEKKSEMHYRIGNYLFMHTKSEEFFDKVLYIVNHLNSGSSLISSKEERDRLVELNMMAAKKAKRSGAFESSLGFLRKGLSLLDENMWEERYELALSIHTEAAVAAYRTNNYEDMQYFAYAVIKKATAVLDKTRVYEVSILAATNQNKMGESIRLGLEALRLLGIRYPKNPGKFRLFTEYYKIRPYLVNTLELQSLAKLPQMRNSNKIAAMAIMSTINMACQNAMPQLHTFNTIKRFKLSVKYGLTRDSVSAFATMAITLCSTFWKMDFGYRLYQTALSIAIDDKLKRTALFYYYAMISFRKEHLKHRLEPLIEMHRDFLQAGEIQIAALALVFYSSAFYTGKELPILATEFAAHHSILTRMGFNYGIIFLYLYRKIVQTLMHGPDNPALGTEELVNTEKIFINMTDLRIPALLFVIPFTEMCSSYLFGNYQDACKFADTASEYIQFQRDTILHPLFNFHESLVRIAMYNKMDRAQKRRILQKIKQNQKNLNKFAHHAPMNFLHKFHLVKAELLRIRGKKDAPDYYDKAIEGAIKNEYINEAALAYELAAMYWIEKGKKNIASTYLHDALKYYAQWGAAGKVSQLKKTYPDLMQEYGFMDLTRAPDTGTTAGRTAATANLDLSTIVKASQALSSEFDLSKLLGKIMKLSLTNAGAQKGCLLLDREEGGLFIEAAGKADGEIRVLQSISIGDSDDLSFSVVNYVYKTRENLVLNDALADEKFANDPYIAHNRSKSILCSPIIHKGRMSGMLYLENNLTTGAFTPERLELLNILSSQAAISIENSRLLAEREKAAKLETEMRIASNIQTSLLPKHPAIEGYDITGYMKPADEVGGDYYDVIYADGKNWLIIGDVSGHGVPSGLVMMMVQTSIHTVVKNMKDLTPSRVVEIANRILYENIRMLGEDKYMSITVFLLEEQGAVHFSGLHQDIMIYRADHQDVELIETDGLWLGIKDNINGILRNDTLQLNPGDAMLIYTDGITEAWKKGSVPDKREGAKDMFGSKRLADTLRKWHSHSTPEIRDGILNELAGYDCIDDVTMLIVRKKQ